MVKRIKPENYFTPEVEMKSKPIILSPDYFKVKEEKPITTQEESKPVKTKPQEENKGIIHRFLSEIFQEVFKPIIPCIFGLRPRCRIFKIMEKYKNY